MRLVSWYYETSAPALGNEVPLVQQRVKMSV